MKLALVVVVMWAVMQIAGSAGAAHLDDCERAGRVSCSVLPWDSGEERAGGPLTREQLLRLNEARDEADAATRDDWR